MAARRWALMATALVAACGGRSDLPRPGVIELNSLFEAEFELVDMRGEPATDERFEGEPMLIYFGFASCPDVCPTALGVMDAALAQMGEDAGRVRPLFITVDPERDTPERLARYLEAFDAPILGLTGTPEQVKAARDGLKVFAAKVPLPDSAMGYTMDHQSMFYLTDADGTPLVALDDAMTPAQIAAELRDRLG